MSSLDELGKGSQPNSFDELHKAFLGGGSNEELRNYIAQNGLSPEQCTTVLKGLRHGLQWTNQGYDFLKGSADSQKLPFLQLAVLVFDQLTEEDRLDILVLVSQYLNPWVPWSNVELAAEAAKLQPEYEKQVLPFLDKIRPSLLSIPNVKVSLSGYRRTGLGASGLRPSLGFSGIGSSIFEDDKRKEWKTLQNVTALSTVYGFLAVSDDSIDFQANWPIAITFILNVLDDSDPVFRAQGCHLVEQVLNTGHEKVLIRSGHVDLFLESTESCLHYLPSLTPADVSLHLLSAAYPLLYRLMELRERPISSYTAVLEKNILSSISHVQGRESEKGANRVLTFLLNQAESLIRQRLEGAVLSGFLRLNYMLCQLITNPFLIDADGGAEVVDLALFVQSASVEAFKDVEDQQGKELFGSHKYDLLGSWIVLLRRVEKFKVGTKSTKDVIVENIRGLSHIVGPELQQDYEAALELSPGTLPTWDDLLK
ncbi:hypothetical protein C7M61_005058 [Candidozyma pseudohaemuli]|uniref:Uncharacterized protein n=1 Tax=Candidozyma pseudohaemuli TaxID=418784 RepID=A0A2P7YD23_9ASCO|nr:hypothetical protein C7M61_005058 [[Candida] pseudohaemulonii]PSK33866.1 hypothetical protein C7M61_005058 [[Candida] pseudohaemulonii]